jgi:ATP-binding cassette subfamily B protein
MVPRLSRLRRRGPAAVGNQPPPDLRGGGPAGIGHLENPKTLDDLALAQGQLVNQRTADAPMTLALVMSNRASGLLACAVLASWRWWLGLGMVVVWMIVRRPQLKLIRKQGALYSGSSQTLRRAWSPSCSRISRTTR